jgi:Holliday junction resolvase RusA-like endonuclease
MANLTSGELRRLGIIPPEPTKRRAERGTGAKATAKRAACRAAMAGPALTEPVAFTLPYPPLLNRIYRRRRHGGMYLTDEGKQFKAAAAEAAHFSFLRPACGGCVSVSLTVFRPRRTGDIDATLKLTLDALNGVIYRDDKQVRRLVVDLDDDKSNPRVEVVVAPATGVSL